VCCGDSCIRKQDQEVNAEVTFAPQWTNASAAERGSLACSVLQRRLLTRMMTMGTSLNMSAVVRVSCLRSRLAAAAAATVRSSSSRAHQRCVSYSTHVTQPLPNCCRLCCWTAASFTTQSARGAEVHITPVQSCCGMQGCHTMHWCHSPSASSTTALL
jgi:hypothetical protein